VGRVVHREVLIEAGVVRIELDRLAVLSEISIGQAYVVQGKPFKLVIRMPPGIGKHTLISA
jgi:hypothetical protein